MLRNAITAVAALGPICPSARAKMMVDDSAVILKRFYFLQREIILMRK